MTTWNIQVKRSTEARWQELDYPLRSGEFGYALDTGRIKVGDGVQGWNALPYFIPDNEIDERIAQALADIGAGDLDPRIGVMTDLTTTEQATVVGAINEVNGPPDLVLLYENGKA